MQDAAFLPKHDRHLDRAAESQSDKMQTRSPKLLEMTHHILADVWTNRHDDSSD